MNSFANKQSLHLSTIIGLLKTEKKILSGHYIGLSPKCYVMEDDNSDRKLSHKGVPKHVNLTVDHYMRCLYQNDRGRVSYSNITINRRKNEAVTRETEKVALNDCYFKLQVAENKVSVKPHKINGKFL